MANSTDNKLSLSEISDKLEALMQTASADSLSAENLFMDTEALESDVSIIQSQLTSLNFEELSEQDIEQLRHIHQSLKSLTENLGQCRDVTKRAIHSEQNKSKLKKAYG